MLSQNNNSSVIKDVGEIELRKLILSAKNGDNDAFEEVYEKLYTPLYRYVLSRCYEVELSKDICQQTFLKFYESLHSYEPKKSPLAYLFTIAKRLLINHKDKNKNTYFDESLLDSYVDDSFDQIKDSDLKILSEKINEYLPSLTDDEQEFIRLYFYAELDYKEISNILNKEEAHLRKIKERALKKLRILTRHLYEKQ